MKNNVALILFLMFPLLYITSCKDDDPIDPGNNGGGTIEDTTSTDTTGVTLKVNKFINSVMTDVYLWYDEMPDIDYTEESDPEAYFEKLLYTDDKWSYITDDIDALESSLNGEETSYGWSLAFGLFSNTGNVFAIVEYVYPNTPAATAGIKRGDIIIQMDGADITTDNYTDLLYSSSMSVMLGIYNSENNNISAGDTYEMTAEALELNPVLKTSIVEEDGHKIGYIFYAQYIASYNDSIDVALQTMIDNNVTDLVLDLRYNPGGYVSAARHLCSALAPASVVNSSNTLVTYQWNDKYQTYFEQNNYTSNLIISFDNSVAINMNLNSIHILTGSGTASASELTITGLSPYMTVTTVGDTTYGKYTGMSTFSPEDWYDDEDYYKDFSNYGLMPIIFKYANAEGITDFKDGFAPDYYVYDNLFDTSPLGDPSDPLFAKAIEDITGNEVIAMKKAKTSSPDFHVFDRGFSKSDKTKRELIFDKEFLPQMN